LKKPIIALLLLLSVATVSFAEDAFEAMDVDVPKTKMIAPSFELAKLNGKKVLLSDFKGRLILLNFWATWCAPCRSEMPGMEKLWQKYKGKGFTIVGINIDRGDKQAVKEFVKELHLTFPILLSPSTDVRSRYEVHGLPTTYLIGRDGIFLGKAVGGREWDSPQAHNLIESFLNRANTNKSLSSQPGLLGERNEPRNKQRNE